MVVRLIVQGYECPYSKLRGRLDEIARHLFEAGHDLGGIARPTMQQQRGLIGAKPGLMSLLMPGAGSMPAPGICQAAQQCTGFAI